MMGSINVYMYAKLLGGITRLGIGGEERQGSREVEGGRIQWERPTQSIDANL